MSLDQFVETTIDLFESFVDLLQTFFDLIESLSHQFALMLEFFFNPNHPFARFKLIHVLWQN